MIRNGYVFAWICVGMFLALLIATSVASIAYYGWATSPQPGHCYRYDHGPWYLSLTEPHPTEISCP